MLLEYPDCILPCDRSYIQDTHNEDAIEGTTTLHEVYSGASAVPPSCQPVWPVKVVNLPCNCPHCIIDSTNDECIYSPWRKSKMDNLIRAAKDEVLTEYSLTTLGRMKVPELKWR